VLFRADGGSSVGMGHLVRTHALTQCLQARGVTVRFLTRPGAGEAWLRAHRVAVDVLAADAGTREDAEIVKGTVSERRTDVIVTDGYAFRTDYLASLVSIGIPIASIDDLAGWPFPSALVVNGGIGATRLRYDVSPGTLVLQGPEFLLLRRPFRRRERGTERVFPPVARSLLACFGGADPLDWTALVLETWARLPVRPALHLVVGPAYERLEALRAVATSLGAVVHHDLGAEELADAMTSADVAVASCGMVAGELLALGVPAILGVASEDQRRNADTLKALGAGHLVEPFAAGRLERALTELLADPEARAALSRAGADVVAGRGAERVADAILSLGRAA